jgi:hypothetical protein
MNIIEGIQEQQKSCMKLIKIYESLGPVGTFGKLAIQQEIDAADRAIAAGDVIEMMAVYKRLESCE